MDKATYPDFRLTEPYWRMPNERQGNVITYKCTCYVWQAVREPLELSDSITIYFRRNVAKGYLLEMPTISGRVFWYIAFDEVELEKISRRYTAIIHTNFFDGVKEELLNAPPIKPSPPVDISVLGFEPKGWAEHIREVLRETPELINAYDGYTAIGVWGEWNVKHGIVYHNTKGELVIRSFQEIGDFLAKQ